MLNVLLSFHPIVVGALLLAVAGLGLWLWSVVRHNVTNVDAFWPLGFVLLGWWYALSAARHGLHDGTDQRHYWLLAALTLWGLRLSGYLTWRNWGKAEDRRYVAIRNNNGGPAFWWRSLFIVYWLQAGLIVLVGTTLYGALHTAPATGARATGAFAAAANGSAASVGGWFTGWGVFDSLGAVFFAVGLFFETVGDAQLARFKRNPANQGKVMDRGLWRYTRHPNYFGDAMVWWGFGWFAWAAQAPWYLALLGPVVMTLLLLFVSGVLLLEKDIGERRPAYRDYIARTSPFIPWPPQKWVS